MDSNRLSRPVFGAHVGPSSLQGRVARDCFAHSQARASSIRGVAHSAEKIVEHVEPIKLYFLASQLCSSFATGQYLRVK